MCDFNVVSNYVHKFIVFINYTCCFLRSLGILSGNATEEKKQIAQKWKTVIKHLIKEKPITKSEGTCKYSFGVSIN